MTFTITTSKTPAGDQPKAIDALVKGLRDGKDRQTLFGATGTGKTFTAANVIAAHGKPALVIAHNKTLAAQLAQEYRDFFPDAAVHYFVSYYDYYQPEAYMPVSDTYIEKEAMINAEIDRLRHASTQSLLTRRDVIIVASVSCIYGLGSPEEYKKVLKSITPGYAASRADIIRDLVSMYFERTNADLKPGTFRALGNTVEIMPTSEQRIYRLGFRGAEVSQITAIDPTTRAIIGDCDIFHLFPAKHFVTPEDETKRALAEIKLMLADQVAYFKKAGKVLEAERIRRRTEHDMALIREMGYCNGIENYSRHFDGRASGEPPSTLLSYFPRTPDGAPDFLTIIDESHVTIPQLAGMYAGDRARKETLIEYGFRLPSAFDNRPLNFAEFEKRVGPVIFTSATPGTYERDYATTERGQLVEQIIRPTGLVDPAVEVRGIDEVRAEDGAVAYPGQVRDFLRDAEDTITRGARVLCTTLTKRMAEDLTDFLKERGIAAEYLHSDIKTMERVEILTRFRLGEITCIVGVNLLREGLDLPEVELVAIMDADKEGFLRSDTALIQTIGRAARNVAGRVTLYADASTGSMQRAIAETERRRALQVAHNTEHGITPRSIAKEIKDITADLRTEHAKAVDSVVAIDAARYAENPTALIEEKRAEMAAAAEQLDFETAALLRDEIAALTALGEAGKPKRARKPRA